MKRHFLFSALRTQILALLLMIALCASAFGQTSCIYTQGGRYVLRVYNGYNSMTIGTSDRACAIQLVRQVRYEGIRTVNPYTGNTQFWAGSYFDLVDVQDPSGAAGTAKAIMKEALPNAAGQ